MDFLTQIQEYRPCCEQETIDRERILSLAKWFSRGWPPAAMEDPACWPDTTRSEGGRSPEAPSEFHRLSNQFLIDHCSA